MRSPWPARVLLPAAQALAEGSWLAVVYAALQAATGQFPWIGPLEFGVMAGAGMAWGRRKRWRSPVAEALGLPLLALVAGAFCWLLDPVVRGNLAVGQPVAALSLHGPAWLGAVAFWRGEVHRSIEDDDVIQDRLLRWVLPGLAIPWLVGHAVSSGAIEEAFTSAAFVGTVFFIGSAFTAMGLSRLEAVRAVTGSDWRSNRSWVVLVVGVAIALTLLAAPAAAFLGVPAKALLAAVVGPIQTILFVLVLLLTPVILVGALLADLVRPLLPEGFGLGQLQPPDHAVQRARCGEQPAVGPLLHHPRLAPPLRAVRAGRDGVDAPPGASPHAGPGQRGVRGTLDRHPASRSRAGCADRRRTPTVTAAAGRSRRRLPGSPQFAGSRWALGPPPERDACRACRPHPG